MDYVELERTGVRLPRIGLGTWQYKGGVEPLRKGVERGACLIDTAESYGTEEIVGQAIRGMRDRIFLATKVSPQHFRRPDLIQAADNSLRRLKTDRIDLYQLHYPSPVIPLEETMAAMEELVDAGKVRFIGVSNFWLAELKKAQSCLPKYRIVSNQMRYSLVDRTIEFGLLRYCHEAGITILAYSPLAHNMRDLGQNDRRGVLRTVAAATGRTEAQVAINWCLAREGVIAIPKADSMAHTVDNCQASDWRLSPEQISMLEQGIRSRGRIEFALRQAARRVLPEACISLGKNVMEWWLQPKNT